MGGIHAGDEWSPGKTVQKRLSTMTSGAFAITSTTTPDAVNVLPDEIYLAPSDVAEKAYPKLIHYNKFPKGTHFAAWEQPQLFTEEIRASFRSLR